MIQGFSLFWMDLFGSPALRCFEWLCFSHAEARRRAGFLSTPPHEFMGLFSAIGNGGKPFFSFWLLRLPAAAGPSRYERARGGRVRRLSGNMGAKNREGFCKGRRGMCQHYFVDNLPVAFVFPRMLDFSSRWFFPPAHPIRHIQPPDNHELLLIRSRVSPWPPSR